MCHSRLDHFLFINPLTPLFFFLPRNSDSKDTIAASEINDVYPSPKQTVRTATFVLLSFSLVTYSSNTHPSLCVSLTQDDKYKFVFVVVTTSRNLNLCAETKQLMNDVSLMIFVRVEKGKIDFNSAS